MTKVCLNCVHHTPMGGGHYCARRITIANHISQVTGLEEDTLKSGKYSICENERRKASTFFTQRCGPDGQFFENGYSRILGIQLAESNREMIYV